MVTELDVHGPLTQLRHAVGEVVDHRNGAAFLLHLEEGLIFTLQHQDISHSAEWYSQVNDFRLRHVIGNISDVDHFTGSNLDSILLHLETFGVLVVVVEGDHVGPVNSIGETVGTVQTKLHLYIIYILYIYIYIHIFQTPPGQSPAHPRLSPLFLKQNVVTRYHHTVRDIILLGNKIIKHNSYINLMNSFPLKNKRFKR